ncbi:hypothetical protein [Dyadobacter psychrotolerans]|uniref:Glycosyltransferase RgtA/B/C/D-like domain-containing protein n=1 Tax=Dyadobacter psychrotolerans TaxID=2541721 RepID=A0A4R5DQU4_9BACT|nr:hypothetical protein [Dyadobacter psychrotolerans]TDE16776.1 hypothetical protein E0F88_11180 [Dyadobacter psychrotolerans]
MERNKKLLLGVAGLPVVIWVFIILSFSVNVPWFDDFDPFPDFLRQWIYTETIAGQVKLLFQPNNEHRMVVGKLVTLLYYKVTGNLNITFLHIAGACFTLGTLSLFWSAFKKSNLNLWYFLPVPFLLFQFQYHLVFLWAICSLQHQPVIFFVSLAMYLLVKNRFSWAVLAAICATFAMSNGIFVWVAGAAILLLRANYRQLTFWCIAGALAVSFYFFGMSAQGNESSFDFFVKNPHLSVFGFFAFLGGLFDLFPEKAIFIRSVLPVIMGLAVMIWVGIWLYAILSSWLNKTFNWQLKMSAFAKQPSDTGKNSFQEFLFGIMVFLLVNALVIALLRPRFGFFVMIVSNYKLYPALFLVVAYLSFVSSGVRVGLQKRGFQLVTYVSILIWLISVYTYLPSIIERRKYLLANAYNQEHNGFGLGHVPFSLSAAYVDELMKEMVEKGIYSFPSEKDKLANTIAKITAANNQEFKVNTVDQQNGVLIECSESPVSFARNAGQYAFVRNESKLYIFKLTQNRYSGRNIFRQYDKGSSVEVPFAALQSGTYKLGVINFNDDTSQGRILRDITIP